MCDVGHELLYTTPYVSELQPIELIWAYTKHLVARQSHRTRTVDECAIQTRQAMDQVNKQLCRKVISHCHRWIQQYMMSENGGSLRQFIDLPRLMWAVTNKNFKQFSKPDDNDTATEVRSDQLDNEEILNE
jgi:hypothetical protein